MVNDLEKTPGEDRVTTEGWLLLILVIMPVVLSVHIQLAHPEVQAQSIGRRQVLGVVAW